jgi:hypothetical protein
LKATMSVGVAKARAAPWFGQLRLPNHREGRGGRRVKLLDPFATTRKRRD